MANNSVNGISNTLSSSRPLKSSNASNSYNYTNSTVETTNISNITVSSLDAFNQANVANNADYGSWSVVAIEKSDYDKNFLEVQKQSNATGTDIYGSGFSKFIEFGYTSTPQLENQLNLKRLNEFKKTHTLKLFRIIDEQNFEYGYESEADEFIRDMMNQNRSVTKEWINSIFIENFENSKITVAILQILSHMEYFEVIPQGPTMAIAGFSHNSLEVRETAIRAFENWGTKESLSALKSVKFDEPWMQEYQGKVIADLEMEFE